MRKTSFRAWREGVGITQQQAADLLGCDIGTIGRWDRGYRSEHERTLAFPTMEARLRMWAHANGMKLHPWPIDEAAVPEIEKLFSSRRGLSAGQVAAGHNSKEVGHKSVGQLSQGQVSARPKSILASIKSIGGRCLFW